MRAPHELSTTLSITSIDDLLRRDLSGNILVGSRGTVPFLLYPRRCEAFEEMPRAAFSYVRQEDPRADPLKLFRKCPYLAVQSMDIGPGKQFINAYMAAYNVQPDFVSEYVENLSQYLTAYPFAKVEVRYIETVKKGFLWGSMPDECVRMLDDMQKTQRSPSFTYYGAEEFLKFILWCFEDEEVKELRFTPFAK